MALTTYERNFQVKGPGLDAALESHVNDTEGASLQAGESLRLGLTG